MARDPATLTVLAWVRYIAALAAQYPVVAQVRARGVRVWLGCNVPGAL